MMIRKRFARATSTFLLPAGLAALAASPLAGCLAPDAVPGADGGGGATGSGAGGSAPSGSSYELAWARSYGVDTGGDQRVLHLTATPDGGALASGEFEGELAIGPLPPLDNTIGRDGFVTLFDPAGEPQWTVGFTGFGDQRVFGAQPAPGGGFVIAGTFSQSLIYDGADEGTGAMGLDGFVARIADDLSLTWLVRIGGEGDQAVHSVALTKTGTVVVGGYFQDTLEIGDLVPDESAEGRDFFVAAIDPTGKPLWGTSLGGDPVNEEAMTPVCLVATGSGDDVHVAGTFTGTVRIGENLGAVGEQDVFIAKLDGKGKPLWGHVAGMPDGEQQAAGLAVSSAGVAALAGDVQGKAQFDSGTTLASDGPEPDAFLAVYSSAGQLQWARRYGSKAQDHGSAVAFDPAGNILFAGRFRGSITFGDQGVLQNNGAVSASDDIFLAALTPGGKPLSSIAFGKNDNQLPTAVAATAEGEVLLGGWFNGIVDLGSGDLDAKLGADLFAAKLTSK